MRGTLPELTGKQCLELQAGAYKAFRPTLFEVGQACLGKRIHRGKDAKVYLVNGNPIGLMLREK